MLQSRALPFPFLTFDAAQNTCYLYYDKKNVLQWITPSIFAYLSNVKGGLISSLAI